MLLHLLDGTYELFRAYFGVPKRRAPDGREVGAINGIISTTLSLLEEPDVTHIGVAFDTVITSYRNDIYAGYKTGEGIEEDLLGQFPLAEEAMRQLGITVWSMIDYEADDALATAAHRFSGQVEEVIVLSPDKDMAQCVGGNVYSFDRRQRIRRDAAGVIDKFGVPPESIPDYLALVGDAADGYPGLPGWGAKSSSAILTEYGHIESIPLDPALWRVKIRGADRLAASLREGIADVLLFRYLALLRRDVPLTETLDDLKWVGAHRTGYEALCDDLGFDQLKSRPPRWIL